MTTISFCEIDPFCRRVLAKHWPEVPCHHDVRELSAQHLTAAGCGDIDLICGGFPCQDISVAGRGAGLAGERSGLWSEFARLIGEIRPRYAIVENVAALLGRGLRRFSETWPRSGMMRVALHSRFGRWRIHIRDRIWIVACATAADGESKGMSARRLLERAPDNLATAVRWATPSASDYKGKSGANCLALQRGAYNRLADQISGGQLNPTWVEWLMGLPLKWTNVSGSSD